MFNLLHQSTGEDPITLAIDNRGISDPIRRSCPLNLKCDVEQFGVLMNKLVRREGGLTENRRSSSVIHNKRQEEIQWGFDHKIGTGEAERDEDEDCDEHRAVERRRSWQKNIRESLLKQGTRNVKARLAGRDPS
jgi:hypothetical protein